MPDTFTIDQIKPEYLSRPVQFVRIVSHSLGPVAPGAQLSQNHWSIYLRTGNQQVIRINMTLQDPSSNNDAGTLGISPLGYELTIRATGHWDFQTAPNLTVWHFTNNIVQNRRQNYRMTQNGVGCRYWVLTVIHDWQSAGLISQRTTGNQELGSVIVYNWSKNHPPVPLPILQGTFF